MAKLRAGTVNYTPSRKSSKHDMYLAVLEYAANGQLPPTWIEPYFRLSWEARREEKKKAPTLERRGRGSRP